MTGLMSHSKEPVWKYFNCELDESGTPVDPNRIVCFMCVLLTKHKVKCL